MTGKRDDLAPCGTAAAYRRHFRAGEKACQACRDAESLRRGHIPREPDRRQLRNGMPAFKPYVYRGRGYDQLEEAS